MASAENPPRLSGLQEPIQRLRKVGWLERLCHWLEREQGGESVSGGNGDGSETTPAQNEPTKYAPDPAKSPVNDQTSTEEFLALLPENFPPEGKKLGLELLRLKRKAVSYPAFDLGPSADAPYTLGSDWRRHAPPGSKAYQDAIDHPTEGLDHGVLDVVIDIGLPGLDPDW